MKKNCDICCSDDPDYKPTCTICMDCYTALFKGWAAAFTETPPPTAEGTDSTTNGGLGLAPRTHGE